MCTLLCIQHIMSEVKHFVCKETNQDILLTFKRKACQICKDNRTKSASHWKWTSPRSHMTLSIECNCLISTTWGKIPHLSNIAISDSQLIWSRLLYKCSICTALVFESIFLSRGSDVYQLGEYGMCVEQQLKLGCLN